MAARHFLLHRLRLHSFQGFTVAPPQGHRLWCSATSSPEEATENASGGTHTGCSDVEVDYPKGCVKEEKIVSDIAPVIQLAKHIIFSPRYKNGEPLSMEDERAVAKNLLIYHPDYEDKIGSGLYAITVDKHPLYLISRCLFVERIDGSRIDFSYRVCLKEYIEKKYQTSADRFVSKKSLKGWTVMY
ncbi:protein DCL homolog, chloroplastic-like isoform X1 [Vigna unguiculata]|uniref:protein DCL homolog, chloroplastic-like isoform X1 n=1 Tax=Vigna unguiculata TaxID=3917 RepID=UPI00101687E1|nr:protein DCL homolog, chloroplastic-like isoform X1 [Vigna unguiculata]